jgi:hypothetical protein
MTDTHQAITNTITGPTLGMNNWHHVIHAWILAYPRFTGPTRPDLVRQVLSTEVVWC